MENRLIEQQQQSMLLHQIMTVLKEILRQIKDQDIDEEFYNNLFSVIDKTANVVILHLEMINEI